MTTSQITHKLELLEERMGARELPQIKITIDFVETEEARPTGRIKRIRWVDGEEISREELRVDPETLLRR